MGLTNAFYEAVNSGKVRRVRIMMEDSLLVDPTFVEFHQMEEVAGSLEGLYDAHDGVPFIEDSVQWNDEYMNLLKVHLIRNFSHERLGHLQQVVSYLHPHATPHQSGYTPHHQPGGSQPDNKDYTNIALWVFDTVLGWLRSCRSILLSFLHSRTEYRWGKERVGERQGNREERPADLQTCYKLTRDFIVAIESNDITKVRRYLAESLLLDPSFTLYPVMKEEAGELDVYVEHEGDLQEREPGESVEAYLGRLKTRFIFNFSVKRELHLKQMITKFKYKPKY